LLLSIAISAKKSSFVIVGRGNGAVEKLPVPKTWYSTLKIMLLPATFLFWTWFFEKS